MIIIFGRPLSLWKVANESALNEKNIICWGIYYFDALAALFEGPFRNQRRNKDVSAAWLWFSVICLFWMDSCEMVITVGSHNLKIQWLSPSCLFFLPLVSFFFFFLPWCSGLEGWSSIASEPGQARPPFLFSVTFETVWVGRSWVCFLVAAPPRGSMRLMLQAMSLQWALT